jgi:hypothetical protein
MLSDGGKWTMGARTGTHVNEENESTHNGWIKNHQISEHIWERWEKLLHNVWKKSYLEVTRQYGGP